MPDRHGTDGVDLKDRAVEADLRRAVPRNEHVQDLRRQPKDANMGRAMIYAVIYEELRGHLGAGIAEEVITAAIYRRGLAIGQRFAAYGPSDLDLQDAVLKSVPDKRRLFSRGCSAGRQRPRYQVPRLPLEGGVEAAGIELEQIRRCGGAGVVDHGRFEAAVSLPGRHLAPGRIA